MQQFLLLLTPPRFSIGYTALNILRIQGLLHATPYAFSFMLEYTRHKIFLSCHIYNMLKKYSFWRKKKKNIFLFSALISDGKLNTQIYSMHIQIDNSPALPDSLPDSLRSMVAVLRAIVIIWLAGILKLLKAGCERKETESSFSEIFVTNL